ncbi:PSD1 and planctomycete cytochrome C domain-containing protein [Prosthecobacter fluviatilis]|uniref:PSD1 and planctomycete cytochrome C domain-containing protein n=1 Tax=Prosthecobacter fluviatilis TaxID=445931 RepID=A0ABW0KNY7_9BACT
MRAFCVFLSLCSALPAASIDFSRDIQPILSDKCYFCHGPDARERKGDLRLDVEKEAKAVKEGVAAIAPGKSAQSTLIERIFSTDPDEVMPTPKSNRTLTEAQKRLLKQWIDEGAKWGTHWAFERIERPRIPDVGAQHPIDALVRAKLAEKGMKPAPRAAAATLLRRVFLDLTGLPPTPDELGLPYDKAVARLLDSPRFGERWAWDWLDAARYADTNGYQGDPERTMWPWRDWVVQAINANMPYDQFTVWQLAGDLLPGATQEQKLASGFNRNHMINGEGGRIAEETRVENVMDRVETTSTVWLGLTMGCSKCHDHKFDPLTMRDYYGLYDVFNQTSEDGKGRSGQAAPAMDMSTAAELAQVKAASEKVNAVAAEVEAFELTKFPRPAGRPLTESEAMRLPGNLPSYIAKTEPKNRGVDPLLEAVSYFKDKDAAYTNLLQRLLAAVRARVSATSAVTKVMIMDTLPAPRETFVLEKGAYDKPTATKVSFNVPASLPAMKPDAPRNRLGLAQWMVSRDNPLTARVTVNRFWQALFGVGLVKTAEDFGLQGEVPPQRELLDWLAAEFMESGWDVKALLRLIVTSETYRQSSKITDAQADPENRWLARGPRFRMPSWMLRDQALAVSGLLQGRLGGPAVKPYQPEGIWEEATFGKKSYVQDHGEALYRRTLYVFWRRIVGPTMLFDNAARQTCVIKATRTNTPLHALVTLNDVTYVEAARALAQRVLLANRGNEDAALAQAFRLVLCREPARAEAALLKAQLGKLRQQQSADRAAALKLLAVGESKRDESLDAGEHAAWTGLCLLLLNTDEALTKE